MKTLPVEKQEEHTDQPAEDVRRPEEQLPSFLSAMTETELLASTHLAKRSSSRMKQSDVPACLTASFWRRPEDTSMYVSPYVQPCLGANDSDSLKS